MSATSTPPRAGEQPRLERQPEARHRVARRAGRFDVEHLGAGDRALAAGVAEHDAITGRERDRREEAQTRERAVVVQDLAPHLVLTGPDVGLQA